VRWNGFDLQGVALPVQLKEVLQTRVWERAWQTRGGQMLWPIAWRTSWWLDSESDYWFDILRLQGIVVVQSDAALERDSLPFQQRWEVQAVAVS
jgi:hypothetical protein